MGLVLLLFPLLSWAYDPSAVTQLAHETPAQLKNVGIKEHLGDRLDPNLEFTNDDGEQVKIGEYFRGNKPVLLSIVYYSCPNLCNYHLNGMTASLKQVDWTIGNQFEMIAVSMDHKETPALAAKKKASYLKEYGRTGADKGWHFLVGTEENVRKLANSIGFGFEWNEEQKQYAHASAAVVVTPGGQLSRYLYGIEFDPKTVRMSLLEASSGKIGTIVDQLILYCFKFDPTRNKYSIYVFNVLRISALIMLLALGLILVPTWLRERRRQQ